MARRLTDTEAMLWNLEQNPQLGSTMGAVAILDGPPDPERLRTTFIHAIAGAAPLRERVQPSVVPLLPPEWVTDTEIDLDHHLRFIRLPAKAGRRRLMDQATALINDPFDRTRPLWQITTITGLPRGRAALVIKLHHSIADGQGALALAAHVLEFEPDAPPPEAMSLDDVMTAIGSDEDHSAHTLAETLRVGAEKFAGLLNDAASSLAHPSRTAEAGTDAVAAARSLAEQLPSSQEAQGSMLWRHRSRNRRSASLLFPVGALRSRSAELGVRLNDLFVVACAEAALRQHQRADVELEHIHATVVVSTRRGEEHATENAFLPISVVLPGTGSDALARLEAVHEQVREKRARVEEQTDMLGLLGSFANLLPPAISGAVALDQARRIDFATSNLPGPPIPVWIAGRKIESLIPLGPLGGTAFNATLLSYNGEAAVSLHADPAAIGDVGQLLSDFRKGLQRLGVTGLPR